MSTTNDSIHKQKSNQNIQVFVRVRPTNARERLIKSNEAIETHGNKDVVVKPAFDSRSTKKFSFDRAFGMNSQQHEVYQTVVAPLIQEVIDGYNCTVFAYGQTGTGKTYTMVGEEQSLLSSQYDDISNVGMIPRAFTHLFDKLRLDKCEFAMRVSYLELYNEELCDLLSSDDNVKVRIYDDINKKGSVIVQGLEEIPVKCKNDVYKLLAKGQERRKTAATLMNSQSSRSHTVFSILVHIKENNQDGEEMLKIGKLNLVDLAGSENASKAGNEKGIRTRESVNINQSLLTLGRVITALVERTPHIPYRESKLTRLLQESLGGRTKTSIIATISCGHKDLEETLNTLDYAHRAKNIQNKPEINQRLTKKVILKEYTEEIDRLKRDLLAAREKNGIYLASDSYNDLIYKMENTEKELNEVMSAFTKNKEELNSKMRLFEETKRNLEITAEELVKTEEKFKISESELGKTKKTLRKTERSYTEAKHIIVCHQETEQQLTEHTKEIIKVADEASHDTKTLQENIQRRKEKDEKAAFHTDNLMSILTKRMENMQKELIDLEKSHNESSDIVVSDLNAYKNSNADYTATIVDAVKELSDIQTKFHGEFHQKFDKWMKSQDDGNSDFLSFASYLKAAKQSDEKFFKSLTLNMSKILELLNARKSHEMQLSDYILEKLSDQQKSNDDFTNFLQSKFNYYCEELNSLKSSMKSKKESQNSKIQEIKKLFSDLEALTAEQNNFVDEKLSSVSADMKGSGLSAVANFVESSKLVDQENANYLKNRNSSMNVEYNELIDTVKETTNVVQEDELARKESTQLQQQNIQLFENDVMNHISSIQAVYNDKNAAIVTNINEESSRVGLKLREITSMVQHNLHLVVNEAQKKLLHEIQESQEDVGLFRNDDIFAYKSTGGTPARKDYRFSRQLQSTSPHERIIKRMRLEQGLSDSLLHDSSIIEEDEMDTFISKEICNSTAIVNVDTPSATPKMERISCENRENIENNALNF